LQKIAETSVAKSFEITDAHRESSISYDDLRREIRVCFPRSDSHGRLSAGEHNGHQNRTEKRGKVREIEKSLEKSGEVQKAMDCGKSKGKSRRRKICLFRFHVKRTKKSPFRFHLYGKTSSSLLPFDFCLLLECLYPSEIFPDFLRLLSTLPDFSRLSRMFCLLFFDSQICAKAGEFDSCAASAVYGLNSAPPAWSTAPGLYLEKEVRLKITA
jgi:hypothetical protein